MDNNELLKKRISELSNRAFERGYTTYTDFLNIQEISTLSSIKTNSVATLYGGYTNAERCICAFSDSEVFTHPITCIKAEPLNQKFSDKLTHRDFLGALMNLGIEREMIGDIKIIDNVGYIFCINRISNYIVENLLSVKHTSIKCTVADTVPQILNELPEETEFIVSSLRIDTVLSAVYKMSRSSASQLINQQRVFINSNIIYKDSVLLKDGDVVSARGYGKFIYSKAVNETKKHKIVVAIRVYR